ncbi:kinesin-associated protein-domain-containing protein [Obelidium mucronatum]|nr:kinesin-associated protein-domain-containing protein [Obelidium mucronatum]
MTEDSTKRKITYISIDVHPSESAIIVNYYLQLIALSEKGKQTPGERKAMQKSIKVKVSEKSDIIAIAREIIEKYPKLIPAIKMRDLESSLIVLQKRGSVPDLRAKSRADDDIGASTATSSATLDAFSRAKLATGKEDNASLDMIEQYIEGLYEDTADKIASTKNILSLAKNPQNLDLLMENVLREDNKKSMELVTNIIYIFFCFSNFPQYHPFITANKVELHRFGLWSTGLQQLEAKCLQNSALNRELEKEHRKFQADDQETGSTSLYLSIEVKMVKRHIVQYLLTILDRETPELLVLTITFLKKLSVFKENKDELVHVRTDWFCLISGLKSENHRLSLKLLLNLSHDKEFRTTMVRNGCLSKISELLSSKTHVILTLQLLYQISIDDQHRDLMAVENIIPQIIKMILEYRGERVNTELMAVAINMAASKRNSEILVDENGLKFLVKRALKTKDVLILKMLRNISMHDGDMKFMFLDYIDELMILLLKNSNNPAIFVEVMGILGNLNIPDFDFAKLAHAYSLVDMVQKTLASAVSTISERNDKRKKKRLLDEDEEGMSMGAGEGLMENDDITLEAIILLGTMAHDENIAPMVAKTETIPLLMDLMIIKEEDDEMILQIIYCIYHFLLYESTRTILINKTQVVSYLIDLLYDRNREIRKMCDTCLDIISEINDDWVKKIKQQKFQWHNSEYLQVMADILEEQEEAAAAAAAQQQQSHKSKKGTGAGLGNSGPMAARNSNSNSKNRKTAIGSTTYYAGLDDSDSDEEEFARQIGGTSAILDGP